MMKPLSVLSLSIAFALTACSASSTKAHSTPKAPPAVDQRNAALVRQHTEIWNLMELSPAAIEELNGIVVAVNSQMAKNREEMPAAFAEATAVKRAAQPLTHADYIANHQRRFDALGISASTRAELLASAEFVWKALHDPSVPAEKRRTAETIQTMMKSLGGPPPCCDDNIFARAAH